MKIVCVKGKHLKSTTLCGRRVARTALALKSQRISKQTPVAKFPRLMPSVLWKSPSPIPGR